MTRTVTIELPDADTAAHYSALADDIERHLQAGGRNFLLGGAQLDWTVSALRALVRQRQRQAHHP